MIDYDGRPFQLGMVCRLRGSVFPKATVFAFPTATVAVLLQLASQRYGVNVEMLNNTAAYSSFSFVVGFLLVFRTSQAYTRFWEGTTLMQLLRGQWVGAFSSLLAFSAVSKVDENSVDEFRHTLIRLFSLLHPSALEYVCTMSVEEEQFSIIGVRGIDTASIEFIHTTDGDTKIYVIIQWIQQLILSNLDTGVLPVAPPIVSRVFQDLSTGIVTLNNARKISDTPFPFPYAQMVSVVLMMHLIVTPVAVAGWTTRPIWAFIFTYVSVFTFWCINFIAAEIEQPFGGDVNDIDVADLQHTYNKSLVAMLAPQVGTLPVLKNEAVRDREHLLERADTVMNTVEGRPPAWERPPEDMGSGGNPILKAIRASFRGSGTSSQNGLDAAEKGLPSSGAGSAAGEGSISQSSPSCSSSLPVAQRVFRNRGVTSGTQANCAKFPEAMHRASVEHKGGAVARLKNARSTVGLSTCQATGQVSGNGISTPGIAEAGNVETNHICVAINSTDAGQMGAESEPPKEQLSYGLPRSTDGGGCGSTDSPVSAGNGLSAGDGPAADASPRGGLGFAAAASEKNVAVGPSPPGGSEHAAMNQKQPEGTDNMDIETSPLVETPGGKESRMGL